MDCCKRCKNFQPKVDQEKLNKAWEECKRLRIEGDRLYAQGGKIRAEGDKFCVEGNNLYAESDKFYAEGNELYAKGKLIFIDAVISVHGNVKIEWRWVCGYLTAEVEGVKYE